MYFPIAKEIWNNLSQAYSMKKDTAACYEIENKIFNTKQGSLSVTDYYGTLNCLWIELDQYQNLTMQCTPDSTTLTQFIERIRIFKFLSGLHSEFDPIRVQILGKEKILSLSEVFHIVRGEETQRLHGNEKVLERIGGFKGAIQRRANHTLSDSESVEDPSISQAAKEAPALSKEELDHLRSLMDSLSKTSSPCALTMTGKGSSFLSFNAPSTESTWIVDSGATDYMTPHSLSFSSYTNSYGHKQITVANGSHIPITGYGNIHLQPSIHLKNVLHVPKLSTNLMSIHKDLTTGRTIGIAKEQDGLYYLQHKKTKHHRATFSPSNNKSSKPFDLVHSDVWGPSAISNISGAKWFVSFIDDCTRVTWIFLMKDKSEVFYLFENFYQIVRTQFGSLIKRLRSDNSREYVNQNFSKFLKDNGVIHELTCVDTLQQNGVAERKNRHLLEVTRALLFQTSVPKSYWGEAVLTATYLINRLPSQVLDSVSPIQFLTKIYPSIPIMSSLQGCIFSCPIFVHIYSSHRGKLDPRAIKCVFIGYTSNKKGYKCYHPQSRKFYISKDVTFHESESFFPSSQLQGESLPEAEFLESSPFPLLQNFTSPEDNKDPESASLLEKNNEENNEDMFFGK
ncbi:uncharacterized protein LOC107611507 [Arachis ipaensis]|uniref:uncharacterized protein LOC107611507 n=1 Tax=Arachis ipaensis TaxID=130454 RepID=UPI0007AF99E3|nr:uncharacterized protein LOC107611507 [Arachis ipaensis]